MNTGETLLAALHHDPADQTTWLALADWLEEADQPQRSELLRRHRAVLTDDEQRSSHIECVRRLLLDGVQPCWPTLVNSIGMALSLIPAGVFLMGSPEDEVGRYPNEGPLHEVQISRPFYMGVYPVTQAEFERVTGRNPSLWRKNGISEKTRGLAFAHAERFPVDSVDWREAGTFCKALSELPSEQNAGRQYRLPTEAEWEYACRGWLGVGPYWCKTISVDLANLRPGEKYSTYRSRGKYLARPCPVGSYRPNPFGLHDLHGQIWEWCSDYFDAGYYALSPRLDPTGPATGDKRVQRGGCWGAIPAASRSAYRCSDVESFTSNVAGLRVVMVQDERLQRL